MPSNGLQGSGGWRYSVKYLFCKFEDLSLISRTHIKTLGIGGVCLQSQNRGGRDKSGACQSASPISQSSLIGELQANERPGLKEVDSHPEDSI